MQGSVFSGAKMAVIGKGQVLTLLRDRRPDIPYPGLWDLPGGGREFGESPVACALRECWEEARLAVTERDVVWRREYGHPQVPQVKTWFLVAKPGWLVLPVPRLGDEGQEVTWMPVDAFLALDNAVPHLQLRLLDYLAEEKAGAGARGLSTG